MRHNRYFFGTTALWVAITFLSHGSPSLFAQRITGDVLGVIYEKSGAVIPGASVVLRNLDTGQEQTTKSSDLDGSYSFFQLPPGRYELQASQPGFRTQLIHDVRLSTDQRARVDITLDIGDVTTTITVEAGGAVLLQTETAELAQVVENRKVRELPLQNRSYVQLGAITPGVVGSSDNVPSDGERFANRSNVSLFVAGQREIGVSYLVDGIETRNDSFGFAGIRPSIDIVEEFKLNRNSFGTEFGNDSAAVVSVTTKAGTNEFHGSVYEFLRNDNLAARNFFDIGKPPLVYNDFGGSLGGPIIKNKLFFFTGAEIFRERRSRTLRGLFPSLNQLTGDLSDNSAGTGVFLTSSSFCVDNPGSLQCADVIDPLTDTPFANNVIPTSRISNFARQYASFVPAANNLSQLPQFNRIVTTAPTNDADQFSARGDYNFSGSDFLFARYIWSDELQVNPDIMEFRGDRRPLKGQNVALGWTHSFSPTLVNTFHAGYNRTGNFWFNEGGGPGGQDLAREVLGLKNTPTNANDFGLSTVSILGFSGMGARVLPQGFLQQLFQLTDNLNYIRGKHILTFGAEFRRQRYFQFVDSGVVPNFNFSANFSGSNLGDFLLGVPLTASTGIGDTTQNLRMLMSSIHVSDAYKATPNLTLNFGLRWEYKSPPTEINDRQAVFDFTEGRILLAGQDIERHIFPKYWNHFAPRFGFAYRMLGGNTVLRGGFGIYWSQGIQNNDLTFLVITPPFIDNLNIRSQGSKPTVFVDEMFPDVSAGGPEGRVFPFTMDRFMRRPYSPQWNLGLQHEFSDNWLLEAAYMGNTSVRNGSFGNVNAGRVDPTGTVPLNERVPYPEFVGVLLAAADGHGSYHAGTLSLTRRFSQGLTLLANYTYAKSIDDSSGEVNFTYRPEEGRKDMRGPSDFDINHRVALSYVYEIPVGKGRRYLNTGGVANAVLGGWQVAGITTISSGAAATVHLPGDWARRGPLAFTRPDCVSNPNQSSLRDNARTNGLVYFDTSGFQNPPPFLLGNCGRNVLRLPSMNEWNVGVHKALQFTERFQLQVRFEFFNTWNHTQWEGLGLGPGTPTYGRITSARPGRDIQLGVKLLF